jgi:hypothetical protein
MRQRIPEQLRNGLALPCLVQPSRATVLVLPLAYERVPSVELRDLKYLLDSRLWLPISAIRDTYVCLPPSPSVRFRAKFQYLRPHRFRSAVSCRRFRQVFEALALAQTRNWAGAPAATRPVLPTQRVEERILVACARLGPPTFR